MDTTAKQYGTDQHSLTKRDRGRVEQELPSRLMSENFVISYFICKKKKKKKKKTTQKTKNQL
jgi:hypothetical protein